jgi:hypothetical protein
MHGRHGQTREHGARRGRRRGPRGVDIGWASWSEPRRSRGRRRMHRHGIPGPVSLAFWESPGDRHEVVRGIDGRRGGISRRASGLRLTRDAARTGASNLYRDAWTSSRVRALSRGAKGLPVRSTSLGAPRP